MKYYILLIALIFSVAINAQNSWYLSQQSGSDNFSGSSPSQPFATIDHAVTNVLQPGDTLFFMGEFTNPSYDPNYEYSGDINDPYIWLSEHSIRISNLHGAPNQYITLKAFDENTIIKGDGDNLFRMLNCSYLRIEGLELYGEVERIPIETALALQFLYKDVNGEVQYRVQPGTSDQEVGNLVLPDLGDNVSRPSYTDTRGIYLSDVHHIDLLNNYVHHVPGNGFRVADCDYINIIGNEVHDTSRKSYSGTHGLVVTNANSFDNNTATKIFILRNKVHHNYNEIYSWAPTKTFITPKIDEGKGISLQRNGENTGWTHGRILVANNLTYWNGFSGVHSNVGTRIDFINNTAYMNSYTGTVTYADDPANQLGNNIGISDADGHDIRIINNISVIDPTWGGFAISVRNSTDLEVTDNLVFGIDGNLSMDIDLDNIAMNTIEADPLFEDADNFHFHLESNSPAIGIANATQAPDTDFFGSPRDANPDLGAIEFGILSEVADLFAENDNVIVYPNPFSEWIFVNGESLLENEIAIYDVNGKDVTSYVQFSIVERLVRHRISTDLLPIGVYFLKAKDLWKKIVKL